MSKSDTQRLLDSMLPEWPGDDATKVRQVMRKTHADFMRLVREDPISKIPMA